MQKKTKELKTILATALERAFGVDVRGEIEEDDIAALIDPDIAFVTCSGKVKGKVFDFNLAKTGEKSYKFVLCCGECKDVDSAVRELKTYAKSPIGKLLSPECEIEESGDILDLASYFAAKDCDEAIRLLSDLLSVLADEDKSKPLTELVKYFD